MADSLSSSPSPMPTKHQTPNKSDPKTPFAVFTSRRSMTFAYGFIFAFIASTVFLVFNNASGSSSPWLNTFLKTGTTTSYRSQFFSIFMQFLPNSTSQQQSLPEQSFSRAPNAEFQFSGEKEGSNGTEESVSQDESAWSKKNDSTTLSSMQESNQVSQNPTFQISDNEGPSRKKGFSSKEEFSGKEEFSEKNIGSNGGINSSLPNESGSGDINVGNRAVNSSFTKDSGKDDLGKKQIEQKRNGGKEKGIVEKASYAALMSKESDSNRIGEKNWMEVMNNCNMFDGRWVRDDSYPLYAPGSCPHIDEPFNCFLNKRPDSEFQKYKWQPKDCNIPRLNGRDMLELLRGKRVVFVGDSLNRNMWESLVCILRNSAQDKSRVFEVSGRREYRTEGFYSIIFKDYNCSVEFFRSPFLVQEWELPDTDGSKKETLRLDVIERSSDKYKSADVLIFNTGHWWTHEKTSKGKGYYQEGSHVYGVLNVKEAFRKALTTWARWVDTNINPMKTLVFFRGYSSSHFRGGRWNSGGQCDNETEPIKNVKYLARYPSKMRILESVLNGMKTPVIYLNITTITDFRKDAHPSIYRKQYLTEEERRSPLRFQDCSHWCLPGVPDAWNELLYAQILIKYNQKQQERQHQEKHWVKL